MVLGVFTKELNSHVAVGSGEYGVVTVAGEQRPMVFDASWNYQMVGSLGSGALVRQDVQPGFNVHLLYEGPDGAFGGRLDVIPHSVMQQDIRPADVLHFTSLGLRSDSVGGHVGGREFVTDHGLPIEVTCLDDFAGVHVESPGQRFVAGLNRTVENQFMLRAPIGFVDNGVVGSMKYHENHMTGHYAAPGLELVSHAFVNNDGSRQTSFSSHADFHNFAMMRLQSADYELPTEVSQWGTDNWPWPITNIRYSPGSFRLTQLDIPSPYRIYNPMHREWDGVRNWVYANNTDRTRNTLPAGVHMRALEVELVENSEGQGPGLMVRETFRRSLGKYNLLGYTGQQSEFSEAGATWSYLNGGGILGGLMSSHSGEIRPKNVDEMRTVYTLTRPEKTTVGVAAVGQVDVIWLDRKPGLPRQVVTAGVDDGQLYVQHTMRKGEFTHVTGFASGYTDHHTWHSGTGMHLYQARIDD